MTCRARACRLVRGFKKQTTEPSDFAGHACEHRAATDWGAGRDTARWVCISKQAATNHVRLCSFGHGHALCCTSSCTATWADQCWKPRHGDLRSTACTSWAACRRCGAVHRPVLHSGSKCSPGLGPASAAAMQISRLAPCQPRLGR